MSGDGVPLARRQLRSSWSKELLSLTAIAAAVALVLTLAGLRRGISDQVSLFLDHQPPVLVGQTGTRDFLSQTSVLPDSVGRELVRVPGVASSAPVTQQYAMLTLHSRRVLGVLIGFEPGEAGRPWRIAEGRAPSTLGEVAVDRVLASEHGILLGGVVRYRGQALRVVGLTAGTQAFMTPLLFATRKTTNELAGRPGTANFFLVSLTPGASPATVAASINRSVPGVTALPTKAAARNDRALFASAFSAPLLAMVAIGLAAAALVDGVTVFSSALERRREFATLKAIGMSAKRLAGIAFVEAEALALGGAAVGIAAAFALRSLIEALAPRYEIALAAGTSLLVAAAVAAISALAALVAVRSVLRLDPVEAFAR